MGETSGQRQELSKGRRMKDWLFKTFFLKPIKLFSNVVNRLEISKEEIAVRSLHICTIKMLHFVLSAAKFQTLLLLDPLNSQH